MGLGPAGPELLTRATTAAIDRLPARYLRTTRHPAAVAVPDATSFDSVYESAASIDDVYSTIVEILVSAAENQGKVLYAVPGSPLVAERTVELLRCDDRVQVEVLPALSFVDLAWAALGIDPVAAGARLVDGRRFALEAAGERGPLLVAQCDSRHVLSEIKLSVDPGPAGGVTVLQRLGLPDASVVTVSWDELDRSVEPDHLTSLYVPELAAPVAGEVVRFAELVRTLRARCPWDREQTHATLTRHLLEEAYEVIEAIDGLDGPGGYEALEEELGDLLFQVVFHATLAAEAGQFTLADVARGVHDKLVGRHPHVFGDVVDGVTRPPEVAQVVANWERLKQAEKGRVSMMDGIPAGLPALLLAHKVQRKVAAVGLDATPGGDASDTHGTDGADGADRPSSVGPRLFALVAEARRLGVDPESALRSVAVEVRRRFERAELLAVEGGRPLSEVPSADRLALWDAALSG
ncbi:MAG: MazG family protein [Acidimicrobiales bacterium]